MLLGICIKRNNIYHYSKPFIVNNYVDNIGNNVFCAQIMRDIDFSVLLELNDNIVIDIIIYPNKMSSYDANLKNKDPDLFTKLGSYNVVFNNIIEKTCIDNFEKGKYCLKLDNPYNLEIEFTTIIRQRERDYIITTPTITGNSNFLNQKILI